MAIQYASPPGTWSDAYGKQLHDQVMQYQADLYKQVEDAIRQAQGKQSGKLSPEQVGGVLNGKFGVSAPAGVTLTTAQKQAQNPLYNPLYDPSSAEYKANLQQISNPTPQIQNPLTPTTTPNVQMPSTVTPPATKSQAINTTNLTQAYQNQNQAVSNPAIQLPQQFQQNFNATPSITPPTGTQGIKMPKFNQNAGFSTNWGDLFSVANNRYTR